MNNGIVLIAGGTGFIGGYLSNLLLERGFEVRLLSRKPSNQNHYFWNINTREIDPKAFENIDYIINLAGANVFEKRWTHSRKQEILASRIDSSNMLFDYVKSHNIKLKAYISASAVGYYGAVTSHKTFTETDAAGRDFLAQVCQKWEEAAQQFQSLNIRTVVVRTGIALGSYGGALPQLRRMANLGLSAAIGSGQQIFPWIGIQDLCKIYIKVIDNELTQGPYNAVAPEQISNRQFTAILAKSLKKPYFLPNVPSFMLKLLLGENEPTYTNRQ